VYCRKYKFFYEHEELEKKRKKNKMSENYFKLPRYINIKRQLVKSYGLDFINGMSALEQLQTWIADANDTGFEYEYMKADGSKASKFDFPYLFKQIDKKDIN